MVEIVGWADRSRSYDLTLARTMSRHSAERRFRDGFSVAALVQTPTCVRASVTLDPRASYVRVEFLDWPNGAKGKAQLHFYEAPDGGYGLVQARLTRGNGAEQTWSQGIVMPFDGPPKAILDIVPTQTRYELPLAGSEVHAEIAAMRFAAPDLDSFGAMVQPELVRRCMLVPNAFDDELAFGLDEPAPVEPEGRSHGF